MKSWIVAIVLMLLSFTASSQSGSLPVKVADSVYMITGYGGNISFVVTSGGVLVVDTGLLEMDGKEVERLVKTVTDKPIKYVVLTHYHYDHAFGASGFSGNPVLVGHGNSVKNLNAFGQGFLDMYRNEALAPSVSFLKAKLDSLKQAGSPEWQGVEAQHARYAERLANADRTRIVLPQVTFTDKMTIYLGGDTIRLIYPGPTHTGCNILVDFVNRGVLATGDFLFNSCIPYIDYKAGCNTRNWIEQLQAYAQKEYRCIIPGHGKLASAADLANQAKYLTDLRRAIESGIKNGRNLSQLQAEVKLPEYDSYGFKVHIPIAIEAIYSELTKNSGN